MAAADVLPHAAPRDTSWTPIIEQSNDILELSQDEFTPTKHIAFKPPSKTYTMKDLQLPEDNGISPFAVSEPFPLFSTEAVMRMRHEVLSPEVLKNCQYSSNLAQCQLRGFARKYAPFVYDVWKHPETLAIISKIAGIELTTEMDLEIGHVNISVKSEQERRAELDEIATNRARFESDEGIAGCPWEVPEDKPIVDWHTDSYPFVCVTMLSDCTTMVGGETALRTGTGEIMKVRGPQMGCAVILQGRYIEHQALRALGTSERITMVTSFRPKSPSVRDDTVLTTVRPISDLAELYNQFSSYRLEILEERVRRQLKELRECAAANRYVPTARLKAFIHEQVAFLEHMDREMVDEARVVLGDIDDSHLLKRQAEKQAQTEKEDEEDRAKKRSREA